MKTDTMIGRKFGQLTVIEFAGKSKGRNKMYICHCDCGKIVSVGRGNLNNGHTKSCGCARGCTQRERINRIMIGKKFGRLEVVEFAGTHISPSGQQKSKFKCRCDCGRDIVVLGSALNNGNAKSCGCYRKDEARKKGKLNTTHRHRINGKRTLTYNSWDCMKGRCLNSKHPKYETYGGRGITVCARWLKFENFLADMGERPIGTTLDRIDNSKGYEPANCRWSTPKEQANNRKQRSKKCQ